MPLLPVLGDNLCSELLFHELAVFDVVLGSSSIVAEMKKLTFRNDFNPPRMLTAGKVKKRIACCDLV